MRLPQQVQPIGRTPGTTPSTAAVHPSGCNIFKKAACAAALLACGTVCVGTGGLACAQCLAGIGAAGCIDCV
ncbi:MAG TPA: hypothetical protein GX405_15895 [Rhizobiales bacterium]|nr:hypothetical protein [Hyphomicrobiales bacterium]